MLKNRETNKELFVVVISLLPTDKAKKEDGTADPKEKFEEVHGERKGGNDNDNNNDNDELD